MVRAKCGCGVEIEIDWNSSFKGQDNEFTTYRRWEELHAACVKVGVTKFWEEGDRFYHAKDKTWWVYTGGRLMRDHDRD